VIFKESGALKLDIAIIPNRFLTFAEYELTNIENSQATPTSSYSTITTLSANANLTDDLSLALCYEIKDSHNPSAQATIRDSSLEASWKLSRRMGIKGIYRSEDKKGEGEGSRSSAIKISKKVSLYYDLTSDLRWAISYERSTYEDVYMATDNYKADIIETKLMGKF